MEAATFDAAIDHSPAQTEPEQLAQRHHPVLARRELNEDLVR
jgi:hypothetical protein